MKIRNALLVVILGLILSAIVFASPTDDARGALASRNGWTRKTDPKGGFSFRCPSDWTYDGATEMGGQTQYVLHAPQRLFPAGTDSSLGGANLVIFIHPAVGPLDSFIAKQRQSLLDGHDDAKLEWQGYRKRPGTGKIFEWGVSYTLAPLMPRWLDIQRVFYMGQRRFSLSCGLPENSSPTQRQLLQEVMDTFESSQSVYDSLKL